MRTEKTGPFFVAIFRDRITHTFASGVSRYIPGYNLVIINQIPPDAPQDWSTGPKQEPGKWGAYHFNPTGFEPRPMFHGPYAFAVGKTVEAVQSVAGGDFRTQSSAWVECPTIPTLRALLRSRGFV